MVSAVMRLAVTVARQVIVARGVIGTAVEALNAAVCGANVVVTAEDDRAPLQAVGFVNPLCHTLDELERWCSFLPNAAGARTPRGSSDLAHWLLCLYDEATADSTCKLAVIVCHALNNLLVVSAQLGARHMFLGSSTPRGHEPVLEPWGDWLLVLSRGGPAAMLRSSGTDSMHQRMDILREAGAVLHQNQALQDAVDELLLLVPAHMLATKGPRTPGVAVSRSTLRRLVRPLRHDFVAPHAASILSTAFLTRLVDKAKALLEAFNRGTTSEARVRVVVDFMDAVRALWIVDGASSQW